MTRRNITHLIFLLLISIFSASAQNQFTIWADEFNYNGLPDPAKWNMEIGGSGWGNNESQYYTNNLANAEVANGVLTITAKQQTIGSNPYTSARITTQDKFEFQYGKIEARILLPYGQGIWPAFWMLGENFNSTGWPGCGEIDIMEMIGGAGNDNVCHSTIHWDNNGNHASYGDSYTLPVGIFANAYHVFSAEWDNQEIRAYMDGILYYTADITPSGLSEFHNDFFIILNLAVGGNWPGYPNASTVFPQTMKIDYVRVYQDDFPQPEIDGPSVVVQGDTVTYSSLYFPELTYLWDLPTDAVIISGANSCTMTAIWGSTSDSITVTASGGTLVKISDPFYVSALSNSVFNVPHIDLQNQLIWQVHQTSGNSVTLTGTNELAVDYSISVPPNHAYIYYEFDSPVNFWATPKMKLRLKTENGNAPANLRVDLYDVNGASNQGNFFILEAINSDGNYHTYYHNFGDTPVGAFLIDQISEIRIYINYGNFVTANTGTFWIQPIEMVHSLVTTINETENGHTVEIFPNPFVDELTIATQEISNLVQVNIFNLNGSKIQVFNNVSNFGKMSLGHLSPGVYIVEIHSGNEVSRYKVIKSTR
ncbi:MAG: family 16 glycosylhydrolase [Bacteroidales bacterium]|nr:family 16 glycosylhydrolase [Bacteroidales bacterium]MCF8454346.1 family 16 glycosylhydrolase [Bacteroidales bacterium]